MRIVKGSLSIVEGLLRLVKGPLNIVNGSWRIVKGSVGLVTGSLSFRKHLTRTVEEGSKLFKDRSGTL